MNRWVRTWDWYKVAEEKPGVDSIDKVKHTEKNDLLFVEKMLVDEPVWSEMKNECCEEAEQWWVYDGLSWKPCT